MWNSVESVKLSPAQFIVSLDDSKANTLAGYIFSGYYHKVFMFRNECEMLFGIDQLCDSMGFPQAFFKYRSFEVKHASMIVRKVDSFMDAEMQDTLKDGKATFLVHIQFRKNATWQGSITWVEKDKKQNFRSALEMLKLMDEAEHPGVNKPIDWDGDITP